MMDISVVLLSRGRPGMLWNLLKSLEKKSVLNYEVWIGCDDDDLEMKKSYEAEFYKFKNVNFCFKPRTSNLHEYLNWLVTQTSGDYIFGLNDDCEIETDGWDQKIREGLDTAPARCYGVPSENSIDRIATDYAAFPIISRAAYEALGFFMEPTCGNHGADVVTYRIYGAAGLVYPVDLKIRHLLHESIPALQQRMRDKTAVEMIQRTMQENKLNDLFSIDVSEYVKKVKYD